MSGLHIDFLGQRVQLCPADDPGDSGRVQIGRPQSGSDGEAALPAAVPTAGNGQRPSPLYPRAAESVMILEEKDEAKGEEWDDDALSE